MEVLTVAIDTLRPDPQNARRHGERNLAEIRASLSRYGQQSPLVADADGVVRVGSGRLTAMRSLGWTHAEVVVSDLPLEELRAYAVADNRTAELAEWDAEVLSQLRDVADLDVSGTGFSDAEFDALTATLHPGAVAATEPMPDGATGDEPPADDTAQADQQKPRKKSIPFTPEQFEGVVEFCDWFRDRHGRDGGPKLTDGQIVLLVFGDYRAGH